MWIFHGDLFDIFGPNVQVHRRAGKDRVRRRGLMTPPARFSAHDGERRQPEAGHPQATRKVCFWHGTDITAVPNDVRFRG